jgi:hypothetical protein
LVSLGAQGDSAGTARLQNQLTELQRAIDDVDYRAANVRAGYVYVISNIGSFGERMVKVGLTRRLDPMDRIRELSDASVPFNFDVHALFFSVRESPRRVVDGKPERGARPRRRIHLLNPHRDVALVTRARPR